MLKIVSVLSSILLVFLSSLFNNEDAEVSILPLVPTEVKPGDTFLVELNFEKGDVKGFATFQQYLPEGFSATPVNSSLATFSFNDQLVRFTWIDLPEENSFKISYRIKTDTTCYGLKTLNGEFSYLENNTTKKIELTPSVLTLSNEYKSITSNDVSYSSIIVEKTMSPSSALSGTYEVTLKVKKGIQRTDVHITIPLPEGYIAEPIETRGAIFSFNEQVAEFFWTTMPSESLFEVSYRILIEDQVTQGVLADAEKNTGIITLEKDDSTTGYPAPIPAKKESSMAAGQQEATGIVQIPAPQKGIYYKVQIAATRKSPDRTNDFFKSKMNIEEPVDLTMHEGWKKYLIGTFQEYSAAKKFGMETQTKIPGAFVVAFDSGVRIPLQTARKLNQ